MKSHDFGQFLFNSQIFTEDKIIELITAAKDSVPTLTTQALFLRLISVQEITEKNLSDESLKNFLTPHQFERISTFEKDNSLKLVQALLDTSTVDLNGLEKILQKYHRIEIPPVETVIAKIYDSIRADYKVDYPLALNVMESFHEFLSETLKTSVIFIPIPDFSESETFGASVKITGAMPIVVAVMADQKIFHKMANIYDDFVSDNLDEDFDAISEMLNVFTGNFTVEFAANVGVEEEPEPPRFGRVDKNLRTMRVLTNFGNFYIYVDEEEIFSAV